MPLKANPRPITHSTVPPFNQLHLDVALKQHYVVSTHELFVSGLHRVAYVSVMLSLREETRPAARP